MYEIAKVPMIPMITRYSTITGLAIREFRELKGVSQLHFSSELDVSQASWSRVEKGNTSITVEQLVNAASIIDVEPSLILMCVEMIVEQLEDEGWSVKMKKLDDDVVDSLLDGLNIMLNKSVAQSIDKKLKRTLAGEVIAFNWRQSDKLYEHLTPDSPKGIDFWPSMPVNLSEQSLAKSTKGRVFDTALMGVEVIRKLKV